MVTPRKKKKNTTKPPRGRYVYFGGLMVDTKTEESISPSGKRKKMTAREKTAINRTNKKRK